MGDLDVHFGKAFSNLTAGNQVSDATVELPAILPIQQAPRRSEPAPPPRHPLPAGTRTQRSVHAREPSEPPIFCAFGSPRPYVLPGLHAGPLSRRRDHQAVRHRGQLPLLPQGIRKIAETKPRCTQGLGPPLPGPSCAVAAYFFGVCLDASLIGRGLGRCMRRSRGPTWASLAVLAGGSLASREGLERWHRLCSSLSALTDRERGGASCSEQFGGSVRGGAIWAWGRKVR